MKRTDLVKGESIATQLVTKEEIQSLEKSNHNILRYYIHSSKQTIHHILSSASSSCIHCLSKFYSILKEFVLKNKALYEWIVKFSAAAKTKVKRVTDKVSTQYNNMMYKYNLHSIQKKKVKLMLEGEKEVVNNGNLTSVIK